MPAEGGNRNHQLSQLETAVVLLSLIGCCCFTAVLGYGQASSVQRGHGLSAQDSGR